MPEVNYEALPFNEAIDFFRQKINIPTKRWNDLWQGMHARGFMVAGAVKDDLLADFRGAVDKAISEGTTLAQFRKDFDDVVARHGWSYNGSRGWRSRVIYQTNVRQAYNAGRELQMQDPDLRALRPYGLYKHGDSAQPRPDHLAWDGTVLPLDDPWWSTHTPSNGWGCTCKKHMVSERDVKRLGLKVAGRAPRGGNYEWTDKATGQIHKIPRGIDPGFDYNVGTAAYGKRISDSAMSAFKASGEDGYQSLTSGSYSLYDRPRRVPLDKPKAKVSAPSKTIDDAAEQLKGILNGDEKLFTTRGMPVNVNAESLAAHIDLNRSQFLPLLPELLNNPFEVWLSFEKSNLTDKVVLRQRIIKAVDIGKGKGMVLVANATGGQLEAWTFIPMSSLSAMNKRRRGKLLWGR